MADGARDLLTTDSISLGVFCCPPADPAWARVNNIGANAHVVFPGTPVRISRGRREPQVADSNWAVLYRPGQDYRRHLVHPDGDRCAYVEIRPALLDELVAASDLAGQVFAAGRATVPPSAWLQLQLAVAGTARHAADRVTVESRAMEAVRQVVHGPRPGSSVRRARPPASARVAHRSRRRVEDACELLASDLDRRMTLTDLARLLQVSPYHLARQFRERTGQTVHGYREQARLRAAGASCLGCPGVRLADVAATVGFASHSHLTTRFSRMFGVPPSGLRALVAEPASA
jgi:AraC-like DNA-binding protein